jgi:hypothetical protein
MFCAAEGSRHADKEAAMLDTILGIGASFDWISPLASVLGDMLNGPSHTFLIPYRASPLSGREISWMLGKRGVKSWGYMVVTGTLMLNVRQSQAQWAQRLLEQAGIPIENPVPAQGRARRGGGKRAGANRSRHRKSRRKTNAGTVVDSINDVLNTRLF